MATPDLPTLPVAEESQEARVERLGRQRPGCFKSALSEILFCISIMLSIMMAEFFVSGFTVILPCLSTSLQIPPSTSIWPASAFSLVAGSFFLPFGRLADQYGAHPLFLFGLGWQTIWSIGAGFSTSATSINVCRAFQGFGPAAFLPASLVLISKTYRPGPRKNVVFSIYGACAPLGFFAGILVSGIAGEFLDWRWYFWLGAILMAIAVVAGLCAVPSDAGRRKDVKMDWWGSLAIVAGLVIVVAAITQSPREPRGWGTPYIIVLFLLGVAALAVAVWIEGWVAEQPLVPFDVFKTKGMPALIVALFFGYGIFGVWLLYTTFYLQNVLNLSPLLVVAWYVPLGLGGLILPTLAGIVLHLVSGTVLLAVSSLAWIGAPLLISFLGDTGDYWKFAFPAMICGTIGIDISYNITNIWITTSMVESRQGLAGALINSVLFLGISFFLGWADFIQSRMTEYEGKNLRESYQITLWYAAGLAVVPTFLYVFFIRVGTAKSDLTADEKAALSREDTTEEFATQ